MHKEANKVDLHTRRWREEEEKNKASEVRQA